MWMTDYIREIQGWFEKNVTVRPVPDGTYPMKIDGKMDYVVIENGLINCCNFDPPKGTVRKRTKTK